MFSLRKSCRHSTLLHGETRRKGRAYGIFRNIRIHLLWRVAQYSGPKDVRPYDKTAPLYKEYTAEREKHIVFSPRLRELAARLTAGETNPYLKAKRIFCWINDNFPWASARESIPRLRISRSTYWTTVMETADRSVFLFITLCRISGIPAHFQSGFMMHPRAWNLHDWAEVYFEGVGWVPVDQSFGMPAFARNADEKFSSWVALTLGV